MNTTTALTTVKPGRYSNLWVRTLTDAYLAVVAVGDPRMSAESRVNRAAEAARREQANRR